MLTLLLLISLFQWSVGRPHPPTGENTLAAKELPPAQNNPAPTKPSPWTLEWSDEFNGAEGSVPDATKWIVETGANGWGNHELEYYTNRVQNIQTQAGKLVITARREGYSDEQGVLFGYTSARIKTLHKFEQTYGRFEARIQIPRGQGIWPAFWMLGNDIDSKHWPACGEIDIMESIGDPAGSTARSTAPATRLRTASRATPTFPQPRQSTPPSTSMPSIGHPTRSS